MGQGPFVDQHTAPQQHHHDAEVDDEVGHGIHQGRDTPRHRLHLFQGVVGLGEIPDLVLLAGEGPHYTGTHIVFPGQQGDLVQHALGLMIAGHRDAHDQVDDQGDQHRDQQEPGGHLGADGQRHDQGANNDKGAPQQQTQGHVHAVLQLVDVAGHAGDQGGGADAVQLGIG